MLLHPTDVIAVAFSAMQNQRAIVTVICLFMVFAVPSVVTAGRALPLLSWRRIRGSRAFIESRLGLNCSSCAKPAAIVEFSPGCGGLLAILSVVVSRLPTSLGVGWGGKAGGWGGYPSTSVCLGGACRLQGRAVSCALGCASLSVGQRAVQTFLGCLCLLCGV